MYLHLEDDTLIGVEYAESFFDSFFRLEDSLAAFRAFVELFDEAILLAEVVPTVEGAPRIRLLRTKSGSGWSAVRLYFFIEYGMLKLVHVEHYDDTEP